MTRPALSKQVQQILLRMAQGGQLRGRVSDDQLVGLLEQVRVYLAFLCPKRGTDRRVGLSPVQCIELTRITLFAFYPQAGAANSGPSGGGGKISVSGRLQSDVLLLNAQALAGCLCADTLLPSPSICTSCSSSARAESAFSLRPCRTNSRNNATHTDFWPSHCPLKF